MIDILPRYPEAQLRMRVNHVALGKEIIILKPQSIGSHRKYPDPRRLQFTESDLNLSRFDGSPSVAMTEFVYERIRTWLNEDPLLWCQFGAQFKLDRVDRTFYLSIFPFPRP